MIFVHDIHRPVHFIDQATQFTQDSHFQRQVSYLGWELTPWPLYSRQIWSTKWFKAAQLGPITCTEKIKSVHISHETYKDRHTYIICTCILVQCVHCGVSGSEGQMIVSHPLRPHPLILNLILSVITWTFRMSILEDYKNWYTDEETEPRSRDPNVQILCPLLSKIHEVNYMRPLARDEWTYYYMCGTEVGEVSWLKGLLNVHRMVYIRTLFISVLTSGVLIRGFPSIPQQAIIPSSPWILIIHVMWKLQLTLYTDHTPDRGTAKGYKCIYMYIYKKFYRRY